MRGHLAEEETFWPAEIRRFGEPVLDKVTDKLLKQSMKTGTYQLLITHTCSHIPSHTQAFSYSDSPS